MKRSRINSETKLVERCAVLAEIVRALKPLYFDVRSTETQRDLIETLIGAAIWYMPQPESLWTGKISGEAISAQKNGQRICKDHNYPRKVAGKELLGLPDSELTPARFLELYRTKYGLFNRVTPAENKRLVKHQRAENFTNSEEAYRAAGIQMLDVTDPKVQAAIAAAGGAHR